MMNCNWMVTLAISHRKALMGSYGYTLAQVNQMDLSELEAALKSVGYNFKVNSPFKNR